MSRVAIAGCDWSQDAHPSRDAAEFMMQWGTLLQQAGEDVTLISLSLPPAPPAIPPAWSARAQAAGLKLIEIPAPTVPHRWPTIPALELSEAVAEAVAGFDIVYFQDFANAGLVRLREQRLGLTSDGPVCVTVLHGPKEWTWQARQRYPETVLDFCDNYIERYAAEHSDWVVSPSRYMPGWLAGRGWTVPGERLRILPPPLLPVGRAPGPVPQPGPIEQIIHLGSWNRSRSGATLEAALARLHRSQDAGLRTLRRVTLLSPGDAEPHDADPLRALGLEVRQRSGMTPLETVAFLEQEAGKSLALAVPLVDCENLPYWLLTAMQAQGLEMLCARVGGIPEVVAEACLVEPFPGPLAAKLSEFLAGREASQPCAYDAAEANRRWLEFHAEALQQRVARPVFSLPPAQTEPSVDVCITYYNKQAYFGLTLDSLAQQTCQDFRVIALDDGSPSEEARQEFDAQAARFAGRGWTFTRQPNAFVDAARNAAVRLGGAEFILMLDADDLLLPEAMEQLLRGIRQSGVDFLTVGYSAFHENGERVGQSMFLGPCLPAAMIDPRILGSAVILVRRTAFEGIGGYRELRGAGNEDWELLVRLTLAGYRSDVLPRYLHQYRMGNLDSLSQMLPERACRGRMLESYETALAGTGLSGAPRAWMGMHRNLERMRSLEALLPLRPILNRRYQRLSNDWMHSTRQQTANPLSWLYFQARDHYRQRVPVATRLRWHAKLMRFLGRAR